MENANQRKAVKRKGGWPSDPDIIRPKIKCPNLKRKCQSLEDIETSNVDGTVTYKAGKNPFKAYGETSSGNKRWECGECKQRFTTEKDNLNKITEKSQKKIAIPQRKSSLIERPEIKCPNLKQVCSSYQDIETIEDGTVIYKAGKNPFKAYGETSSGNKRWECGECKQRFTTEKDNLNKITEKSQKKIAIPQRKSSLIERPEIKCPNLKQVCSSYQDIETIEDGTVIYKAGKNPFKAYGETSSRNKHWECRKCKQHFTTAKNNINQITAESQDRLKRKFSNTPAALPQGEGYSTMPQYAAAEQVNQEINQGISIPLIVPEPIIIEQTLQKSGRDPSFVAESANNLVAMQDNSEGLDIEELIRSLEESNESQNSIEENETTTMSCSSTSLRATNYDFLSVQDNRDGLDIEELIKSLEESNESQNSMEGIIIDESRNNQITPSIDVSLVKCAEFLRDFIEEEENKVMETACSFASLEFISCAPPSRLEGVTIELNKPKRLPCPSIWSGRLFFSC